jgi:hypothetical protein
MSSQLVLPEKHVAFKLQQKIADSPFSQAIANLSEAIGRVKTHVGVVIVISLVTVTSLITVVGI